MSEPVATPPEAIPAKRRQILAGARQVFTELGFERASVDLIAARAGVSKATVYNHFADKEALFVASVTQEADAMSAGLRACLSRPHGDLEDALQAIGESLMRVYLSPAVLALYRTVVEALRFPGVGRTMFERGPRVIHDAVAAHLALWAERGALRLEDAGAAAIQFVALCQGDLVARARLGVLEPPVERQVRETVRRAVRTFVRAHRP